MEQANKLKQEWQAQDDAEIDGAIGSLLQTVSGRRFLWWLLQQGKVGLQPFNGHALGTAFNCGEQNVGNKILDRITSVSPEGYLTMMKEMADERGTRDEQLRGAADNDRGRDYGYDRYD